MTKPEQATEYKPTMAQQTDTGQAFKAWLAAKGYTLESFCLAAKPPLHVWTVYRWTRGVRPKDFMRRVLREQFPDCPAFQI